MGPALSLLRMSFPFGVRLSYRGGATLVDCTMEGALASKLARLGRLYTGGARQVRCRVVPV